jgi:EpsD family peptidyl-prolyl cis-trans isomerase
LSVTDCRSNRAENQLVATVNGQDVTVRDVWAATASNLKNTNIKSVEPAAIRNLIDLKLLAQQAKRQGVDAEPDSLALARHAQDLVLSQRLIAHWSAQVPQPSEQEVRQFVAMNPQIFSQRRLYSLDQIETDQNNLSPADLAPLHSMDDVIYFLRRHDRKFQRRSTILDTMTLRLETAREIAMLAPGEPFVANRGVTTIIRSVKDFEIAPVSDDQRLLIAMVMLKRENDVKFVRQKLRKLRLNAKIEYGHGFAPF